MNVQQISLGLILILGLVSVGSSIRCFQCIKDNCLEPAAKPTSNPTITTPSPDANPGNGTAPATNSSSRVERDVSVDNSTSEASYKHADAEESSSEEAKETSAETCDCDDVGTLTSFECPESADACFLSRTEVRNILGVLIGEVIRRECGKLEHAEDEEEGCEFSEGHKADTVICYCTTDDCNSVAGLKASWVLIFSVASILVSLRK